MSSPSRTAWPVGSLWRPRPSQVCTRITPPAPAATTDTVTAQRALEIHADVVLMSKNGVDGVYTADPRVDPDAKKLDRLTFSDVIQQGLRVADQAAFSLCEENDLPMLVFGAQGDDTIIRAVSGEKIGTLITA